MAYLTKAERKEIRERNAALGYRVEKREIAGQLVEVKVYAQIETDEPEQVIKPKFKGRRKGMMS